MSAPQRVRGRAQGAPAQSNAKPADPDSSRIGALLSRRRRCYGRSTHGVAATTQPTDAERRQADDEDRERSGLGDDAGGRAERQTQRARHLLEDERSQVRSRWRELLDVVYECVASKEVAVLVDCQTTNLI